MFPLEETHFYLPLPILSTHIALHITESCVAVFEDTDLQNYEKGKRM